MYLLIYKSHFQLIFVLCKEISRRKDFFFLVDFNAPILKKKKKNRRKCFKTPEDQQCLSGLSVDSLTPFPTIYIISYYIIVYNSTNTIKIHIEKKKKIVMYL